MNPPLRETLLVRGDVDAITGFYFTRLLNLGLVAVGAMAMLMGGFFALLERRITGWAHRGSQGH